MALSVRDVMSTDLVTVSPAESARRAWEIMRDRRVRHLPVVDGDGQVTGVVSLRRVVGVVKAAGPA